MYENMRLTLKSRTQLNVKMTFWEREVLPVHAKLGGEGNTGVDVHPHS